MICGALAMQHDVEKVFEMICQEHLNKSFDEFKTNGQLLTDCYQDNSSVRVIGKKRIQNLDENTKTILFLDTNFLIENSLEMTVLS